jgi:hypothetical protein
VVADALIGWSEAERHPVVVVPDEEFADGGVAGAGVIGVLGEGVGVAKQSLEPGFVAYAAGTHCLVNEAYRFGTKFCGVGDRELQAILVGGADRARRR